MYMRKEEREKHQYFYLLNIKLRDKRSNKDLCEHDYIRLFKDVYNQKIHAESSASKHCIFRTLFFDDDINGVKFISGTLAQFTFIKNDKWFSLKSLDIDEEFKVPNGLFPDAKITQVIFVPKAHRLAYKINTDFKTKPYTIKKFLTIALNEVCKDNEYVQIDVETDYSSFEKIMNANFIKKLTIDINYSNFDNGGDFKEFIENDIKASDSSRLIIEATHKPNKTIKIKESQILTGALESSISNGESEAKIIDENGRVDTIKTSDYPLKEHVYGVISSFNRLVLEKIMKRFRSDDKN